MKRSLIAAALAVALVPQTFAAIAIGNDGELFFNVHDTVNRVSYTLDLGVNMNDFFASAKETEGYQLSFPIGSAIYDSFLSRVSNPATLAWSVLAVDNVGNTQPGNHRLFTTIRRGQETNLSSFTNQQFGLAATASATVNAITTFNISGTHGASMQPFDYTVNGEHVGDASLTPPLNMNYYGLSGGLSATFNGNAPFVATNLVGQSSWFYYLTRSSSSNLASARVLIDPMASPAGVPGMWTFDGSTLVFAPVPEPSTYAMFALGLLGLGAYLRRRKS